MSTSVDLSAAGQPERAEPPRSRDALATRERLLAAARRRFSEAGYDGGSLRAIATDAGVDAALAIRYFGSKESLFIEAVGAGFDVSPLLAGDRATWGERLAAYLTAKPAGELDPTLVLVRSAANPRASELLGAKLTAEFTDPLAKWIGGPDARDKADLVTAILFGSAFLHRVVGTAGADTVGTELLARTLQSILDD